MKEYKFIKRYKKNRLFPSKEWKKISIRSFKIKYPSIRVDFFDDKDIIRIREKNNKLELAQRFKEKWSIEVAQEAEAK